MCYFVAASKNRIGMNVVSLFDGPGTGRLALEMARIPVYHYWASEISKHSIAVARRNFSDIVHIGDVTRVDGYKLPKADVLIGGSPCQGLSVGNYRGLGLMDDRSGLFYHYYRILNELKPKYFFLENVPMRDVRWEEEITRLMGVEPIVVNSSVFGAQHRVRLYWTNIPVQDFPEESTQVVKDILMYSTEKDAREELGIEYRPFDTPRGTGGLLCEGILSKVVRPKGNYLPRERIFSIHGKARTVSRHLCHHPYYNVNGVIRKLSAIENERLQGLPDNFTSAGAYGDKVVKLSPTMRYNIIGDGWHAPTVAHFFKGLKL